MVKVGSGSLPGEMFDLGLYIRKGCFFPIFSPPGSPNPALPYPNPFPNPVGQS